MLKLLREIQLRERLQFGISLIFIIAQVWLDLKLPDYMAEVTRLVQTPGSAIREIVVQGSYMLLCTLGSVLSAVVVGFFAARIAATLAMQLREKLFHKVDSLSMAEINHFSTASLITRSTNDVTQIQIFVTMGIQLIIKAPIMAVWAITKIAGKGLEWSLMSGGVVLILLVMITTLMVFMLPKFRLIQQLTDNLNRVTRENLQGLKVVRAFNAEAYQEKKFEKANEELMSTQLFTSRGMALMMPVMSLTMSGLTLAIYWSGAFMIQAADTLNKLNIFSNMIVFSSYAMQVIMSFMFLVMLFILLPRASISARRIDEVLSTTSSIEEGDRREGLSGKKGEIEFRGVSFRYPDAQEYVLHDINLSIGRGGTVAFIGSTGSGKSTLLHLALRFFDATEGEVLIDGVNVKDYRFESLYDKIGYVPQRAVLFRGTIASNIAYGDKESQPVTRESMQDALAIAQAEDFVEAMSDGYEAMVAQSGSNFSGGQKQRLSIARAVHRRPEIFLFDDSFSALDYKTDRALRSALKKETAEATNLIVAQRIGTIIDADKIVVLDEGRIVGEGTHRELLDHCKVYQEIASSQLSEEELQ